jgi:hypothetical protein
MSRWKIKSPALFVLGCLAFLLVLILILPDIDLPDFTFHGGTAPVVIHAKATSAPAVIVVAPVQVSNTAESWRSLREERPLAVYSAPNFLPILLHSIRR